MYRKPIPFYRSTLAILFAAFCSVQGGTIELGIKEALDRAPEANFQILLGKEAVLSGEEATRISRSALFPQIQVEASQSRAMNPNIGPFSGAVPGDRYFSERFDALLRARLSLFDSRSIDDWRISKLSLQAANQQLENTVEEVLRQICVLYLSHWRNDRRLKVIDATLEQDRLLLEIARNQKEAGVATTLDVTRAEVQLASTELARLQQETRVLDSALELKRALNLPLADSLVLATTELPKRLEWQSFEGDRFEQVLRARQDYRQLETEIERESLSLRASRRERLPSLFVQGQWGYAADTYDDPLEEQWAVTLGLSFPLFEGFRIDAQTQLAASALRQKQLQLADLKTRIEADYRLVLQQVESSGRQVDVAQRARNLNERELELERIRFEEGVADNSDVVDAQTKLVDAEDALVEAEFQYALARINLARTEGDILRIVRDEEAPY
ncbi:MAG: TolC family protein [Oceanipulchritudo sp.]